MLFTGQGFSVPGYLIHEVLQLHERLAESILTTHLVICFGQIHFFSIDGQYHHIRSPKHIFTQVCLANEAESARQLSGSPAGGVQTPDSPKRHFKA